MGKMSDDDDDDDDDDDGRFRVILSALVFLFNR